MKYSCVILLLLSACISAEDGGSKYPDKPVHISASEQQVKLEAAIAPLVKIAKETFPAVKERFKKGLSEGSNLYVTYKLVDGEKFEVVFMKVINLNDDTIMAKISNELSSVKSFKRGQSLTFKDSEIIDWTIVDSKGEEEGNVVGKFLDTYKP